MSADATRPENPELLAPIISHPDEDTPRLMYADWLQENGDPDRAEFICLHIEWDRRPSYAPPNDELKRRLIAAWEAAGLKKAGGIYERGFDSIARFRDIYSLCENGIRELRSKPVRVVYMDDACGVEENPEWRDQFLAVFTAVKGVTGLGASERRYGIGGFLEEFLRLPRSPELRVLDYGSSAGTWDCQRVAEAKHLTNLLVLDCNGAWEMDDKCVGLLAGAPHLQSLLALRLGEDNDKEGYIGPDEIQALLKSSCLTNLRQLVLNRHYSFDDVALGHLLKWDRVGQLEVLEFYGTQVRAGGLRELSRCRRLSNLRRLVINGEELDPEVITLLLDSPYLQGLRELRIGSWEESIPQELSARLAIRFGEFTFKGIHDPPPVCVEDRVRGRYRMLDQSGGDEGYWGRSATKDGGCVLHPEYAIL